MPVIRSIEDSRRRARTGCLACRKRRRKCDEKKPKCSLCQSRNDCCKYPDFTFVVHGPPSQPQRRPSSAKASNEPRINPETSQTHTGEIPPASSFQSDLSIVSSDFPTPVDETNTADDTIDLGTNEPVNLVIQLVPPPVTSTASLPHQPSWDRYFATKVPSPDNSEAAEILYFRYHLVPWMTGDVPGSIFGSSIIALAQNDTRLLAEILSFASHHRQLLDLTSRGTQPPITHSSSIENHLYNEEPTAVAYKAIRLVRACFDSPPTEWQACQGTWNQTENPDKITEPLSTLTRVLIKFDLAASLISNTAPLTSPGLELSTPNLSVHQQSFLQDTYDMQLSLLTQTLHFVQYRCPADPSPDGSVSESTVSASAPETWAKWTKLWTKCSKWYRDRPRAMEPMLNLGSVDAGQIDTEHASSFPMPVYSSTIALQTNVVVHLTVILLLEIKPQLMKLPRRPAWMVSKGWHILQIAGGAVWNDFSEQWDPIFVAGLLWVAARMTHPSQQQNLQLCLERVLQKTGLNLGGEIEKLVSKWQTDRLDSL